jgi:hypothetical protein
MEAYEAPDAACAKFVKSRRRKKAEFCDEKDLISLEARNGRGRTNGVAAR